MFSKSCCLSLVDRCASYRRGATWVGIPKSRSIIRTGRPLTAEPDLLPCFLCLSHMLDPSTLGNIV